MKRSVAIEGPTPAFIHWSIGHPCALRDLEVDAPIELPRVTFRQLRSIRELGKGRVAGRVIDGICLHQVTALLAESYSKADSEAELDRLGTPRGFPAEEVYSISGSEEEIESHCGDCPANAIANLFPGSWAGCYGWTAFSNVLSTGGQPTSLMEAIEIRLAKLTMAEEDLYQKLFRQTQPRWYGLWMEPVLTGDQIGFLRRLLEPFFVQLAEEFERPTEESPLGLAEPEGLLAALERCEQSSLPLFINVVPHGNSDGLAWELEMHCPECKAPMEAEFEKPFTCGCCEAKGILQRIAKRKVLGTRPYLDLNMLLGMQKTRELLERFKN